MTRLFKSSSDELILEHDMVLLGTEEHPVLSVFASNGNGYYLSLCIDNNEYKYYLLCYISLFQLLRLLDAKTLVNNIFMNNENFYLLEKNLEKQIYNFVCINVDEMAKLLPNHHIYLTNCTRDLIKYRNKIFRKNILDKLSKILSIIFMWVVIACIFHIFIIDTEKCFRYSIYAILVAVCLLRTTLYLFLQKNDNNDWHFNNLTI